MCALAIDKRHSSCIAATSQPFPVENTPQAIAFCSNQLVWRYILRLHGIPVMRWESNTRNERPLREYRALVFQHRVLYLSKGKEQLLWLHNGVTPPTSREFTEIPIGEDSPESKIVAHYAVRTIYALGLEYGLVTLAAMTPHRVAVLDVLPVLHRDDVVYTTRLKEASEAFRESYHIDQERASEVVLGADPEFALRDAEGRMVLASDYLGKNGTVGCDSTRYREELALHQHPLVELRPDPSYDPDELFVAIYHALLLAKRKIVTSDLEWIAGGMPFAGYPAGGHIHFSGTWLNVHLMRKLDEYLSLPLALIEDEGCQRRRPRYGFLGDVREKAHGGFEYRTLPSWLVTPIVTRGILHLAKLVATHHWQLQAQSMLRLRVQKAFYTGEKELLKPIVRSIWQELSGLAAYRQSKRQLDAFFTYLLTQKKWPADQDIRVTWKLLT